MKTFVPAKVGRVVGEIAKEREAARIEVCAPTVEPGWNGPQRSDVYANLTASLKLWHDSGSVMIDLKSVDAIDALIAQLGNARELARSRIADFDAHRAKVAANG